MHLGMTLFNQRTIQFYLDANCHSCIKVAIVNSYNLLLKCLIIALLFILNVLFIAHANARLIDIKSCVIKCLDIGFTLKVLLFDLLVI